MALVQISEFTERLRENSGALVDALGKANATQKLAIGAVVASAAVGSRLVRIAAQADCCIAFGAAPTATNLASAAPSDFFPAGTIEVRMLDVGDKISVIAA